MPIGVVASFRITSLTNHRSFPRKRESSSYKGTFPEVCGVDSRLRGNDESVERRCLANDATTVVGVVSHFEPGAAILAALCRLEGGVTTKIGTVRVMGAQGPCPGETDYFSLDKHKKIG